MVYYYIPGKTPYEDLKILTGDRERVTYKTFKKKLGESLKVISLNYPSELLKRNSSSAAILSFHRNKNRLLIGQTMICGKDNSERSIPITKILVIPASCNNQEVWKKLKRGNSDISFPDYEFKFNNFRSRISGKSHINIRKVIDWSKEQERAFKGTLDQMFNNSFIKSGKSMIFNESELSYYDAYFFYSKKKYSKYLITVLMILALFLIIYFTYLNT